MEKTLVVYYSRSGENYVSGSIRKLEKGNGECIAAFASAFLDCPAFRLETVKDYPADYMECTRTAQDELHSSARPALKKIPSLDGVDTLVLIYPNWWGTAPMPVYTFLDAVDTRGKRIIPICTHEGSGMGSSERDLAAACPGAKLVKGLAIKGSEAPSSAARVESYLKNTI